MQRSGSLGFFSKLTAKAEATHFVWNLALARLSDRSPFTRGIPKGHKTTSSDGRYDPARYLRQVRDGDIVWVQSGQLARFATHALPKIKARFILLVQDGDESFPSSHRKLFDVDALIEDPRILRLYVQNFDGTTASPKVEPFPIGVDFHSINRKKGGFGEAYTPPGKQEARILELLKTLKPTAQRLPRAFADFHLARHPTVGGESRASIYAGLKERGVSDFLTAKVPRYRLHEKKGEYAFSISPPGNGLDCHRTWEDLILGCIVIVKRSSLDPLYDGLPVVIVDDWKDITSGNMSSWLERYKDAFTNPAYRERLTTEYWMNKVRAFQHAFRSGSGQKS